MSFLKNKNSGFYTQHLHEGNFAKQSKLVQKVQGEATLEINSPLTFDNVMNAQEAGMDYQPGACFHISLKTSLMNQNTGSDLVRNNVE